MKQKIITALLCVVLIAISSAIGFNTGVYKQKKESLQAVEKNKEQKKEEGKVAVVNMDEGVKYDTQVVNYGATLLASIPIEHVVTGLEDARSGLLTGKYSSYIILPTTFSESVESINNQPQQAPIEYAISSVLESRERETAIYDVQEVYQTLNNNLTQIYMATILEEFHDTQDSASTILDNDKKDTAVLADVSGYDLKEFIKLPELKMVENTAKPLDLQTQYALNDGLMESIDESYKSSLTENESEVDYIKGKSQTLTDKSSLLKASLQSAKEEADQTVVTRYDDTERARVEDELYEAKKDELAQAGEDQKRHNDDVIKQHKDGLTGFNNNVKDISHRYDYTEGNYRAAITALDNSLIGSVTSIEKEERYTAEGTTDEKAMTVLENSYDYYSVADMDLVVIDANAKILEQLNLYYQGQATSRAHILTQLQSLGNTAIPGAYATWAEYLDAMLPAPVDPGPIIYNPASKNLILQIPKEEIDKPSGYIDTIDGIQNGDSVAADIDAIINQAKSGRDERNRELSNQTAAFESKSEAMKGKMAGLDNSYVDTESEQVVLGEHLLAYDPLAYIKDSELREYRSAINKNSREIESAISNQNSSYEKYVSEVATAASENTTVQTEAIQKGQEASDQKLEEGLAAAKSSRNKSNELNSVLLRDLTLKLPYTRIGGVENRTAYTVMSNPVIIQDKSAVLAHSEQVNKAKAATEERYLGQSMSVQEMTIIIVAIIAILLILSAILAGRKRKMAEEF